MHLQRLLFSVSATASALSTPLFGNPWIASDWVASDDAVRGGASTSQLIISSESTAKFTGTLDYMTLGGAGFASQRTIDGWPAVDLSAFDALALDVAYADGKTYTINVFDTVPVPPSGEASVVWAYDFQLEAGTAATVTIPFVDLVPTFRGSVVNDTAPLDLASIKRFSIMIRR